MPAFRVRRPTREHGGFSTCVVVGDSIGKKYLFVKPFYERTHSSLIRRFVITLHLHPRAIFRNRAQKTDTELRVIHEWQSYVPIEKNLVENT